MLSETVGRSRRHWPSHCWLKRTSQGVQLPADDFCMRVYKFHYAHVNFRIILAYFLHLSALLDKIEKIIISLAQRQTGAMSGWICSCSMFIFLPFAQWKDTINFYNCIEVFCDAIRWAIQLESSHYTKKLFLVSSFIHTLQNSGLKEKGG